MYRRDNVVVITFAVDESPLKGQEEVLVPTPLKTNTAKDDQEFEVLLCLASLLEVLRRVQPTGVSETTRPEVFVPTPIKTNTSEDDMEFEWLLCLASTVEAIQCRWPTGVGDTQRIEGFGRTRYGKLFVRESKNVLSITRGDRPSRSQEAAFSAAD